MCNIGIIGMRFVSLAYLIDAMRRIKRVIETDLTQMPNIRIMIAFIVAFAFFASSSLIVGWSIISQEIIPGHYQATSKQWMSGYIFYSTCYFASQTILVFLLFRINTQCKEMNS